MQRGVRPTSAFAVLLASLLLLGCGTARNPEASLALSGEPVEFPVAIDPEWKTLNAWWMSPTPHDYTSVSFLIDRKGVIRYIHPGGKYARGEKDYDEIKATIEKLLAEPA